MANLILLLETQLCHRPAVVWQIEDGVVAEAAVAACSVDDLARAFASRLDRAPVRQGNNDGGVVAASTTCARLRIEGAEQDSNAVVVVDAVPAIDVVQGARRAVERSDLEARIVRKRGEAARLRECRCLDPGVLGVGQPRL